MQQYAKHAQELDKTSITANISAQRPNASTTSYTCAVYNWNAIQAWFFVRISHQSRTKSHISRDAYKNSPLGIHLRVRISSVHETAPWCPRMRSFIRLNTPGRRLGHTFSLETSVFSLISSFRFPPIICLIINDLTAGLCPKTDIDLGVTK